MVQVGAPTVASASEAPDPLGRFGFSRGLEPVLHAQKILDG
jgi:hypothetical protein